MAVTKIWAITDSVSRVLSYAANPDKTIYSDICKALHYASDERKTVVGEEKAMYVTGVNCTAETAFAEMKAVQERFDKTVGNVAYHAYQSFKTGEVTPHRDIDSCHDPDEKAKLVAKRNDCTKALTQLRKDKKTAARIIEDNPKIKENILIEENMRSRYFGLNKSRKRGYER